MRLLSFASYWARLDISLRTIRLKRIFSGIWRSVLQMFLLIAMVMGYYVPMLWSFSCCSIWLIWSHTLTLFLWYFTNFTDATRSL